MKNKIFRFYISYLFECVAVYINIRYYLWAILYKYKQDKLAKRYQVKDVVPEVYGQRHIEKMQSLETSETFYILTSGTSKTPKKILADKKRMHHFQLEFMASFFSVIKSRLCFKTFFSIASLAKDDSFTDFATRVEGELSLIAKLQGPFRILHTALFQNILNNYSSDSLRFFLIYVTSPRFLYGTNPSSIVHFLQHMNSEETLKFTKDFFYKRLTNQKDFEKLYREIVDVHMDFNDLEKLERIELKHICPKLQEVICWDSGYLKTYVKQIKSYCEEAVLFQSMSSMSTEVTQTLCFRERRLPMGREIYYEFYDLEKTTILRPHELKVGNEYIMIISNQHGLIRYDTNDVFFVKGKFFGVPDIIFKRRHGMNFDMAGEKLTDQQVQLALDEVRKNPKYYNINASLVPSIDNDCYKLFVIGSKLDSTNDFAREFDIELQKVNFLYKTRRETDLLGRPNVFETTIADFVNIINPDKSDSWQSQFKFLPLYPYPR